MNKQQTRESRMAKFTAKTFDNPGGLAITLHKCFMAFISAGFSEGQALELAKHCMAMIITFGGELEE